MPKLKPTLRRLLPRLALSLGVLLVFGEIAARVLTPTPAVTGEDNGMPRFRKVPLLPFHPDAATVEKWWDVTADSKYVLRDPDLGWTVGPSATVGPYTSNAQGIRTKSDHLYSTDLPADRTRIVAVGDSFTHGDASTLDDTWTTQLEKLDPRLEVLNFGVPGYGTDQAFLRWRRDASRFKSHLVILGIWPENICRNLSRQRYYLAPTGGFQSKPRFVLDASGNLQLLPSPSSTRDQLASSIARNTPPLTDDDWYREGETQSRFYYPLRLARLIASVSDAYTRRTQRARLYSGQDPAGIDVTVAIAKQFAKEVGDTGATPLILVVPMQDLLATYPGENALPLTAALRKAGLDVIDPSPAFASAVARDGAGKYFADHFTPAGNRLFAEEINKSLAQRRK